MQHNLSIVLVGACLQLGHDSWYVSSLRHRAFQVPPQSRPGTTGVPPRDHHCDPPGFGLCGPAPCTVSVHFVILLRLLESSLVAVDGAGRVMCPVVKSSDTCFLLWHERHSPKAVFAREGTHRGPVQCLSAAPPQVLLLLKGSQAYHGAWRLRLVEGWLLFFSFPSAARVLAAAPELLSSPHSVCVVTRALSSELLPLSTCCVWMGCCCFESLCLLSRARHWRRNPGGTTHVVRPCFQGLQANVCTLSLVSCSVTPPCRRGLKVHDVNLLSTLSRRICCSWSVGTTRRIPHFAG